MTVLRCLFLALFAAASTASAGTIQVTSTEDSGAGTLRAAVLEANAANGDDTIVFVGLSGKLIVLETGEIEVNSDDRLIVSAEALAEPVTISTFGLSRIFRVATGADLELVGLVLSEGSAPDGAGGSDGDNPTDGVAGANGGAIFNEGRLVLRRCVVELSVAGAGGSGGAKTGLVLVPSGKGGGGGFGGGIFSTGVAASVLAEESLFRQNSAGEGGAAGSLEDGAGGGIGAGGVGGSGGAIYCAGGMLELSGCRIESNRAGFGGVGGANKNQGIGGTGGRGGDGGGVAIDGAGIIVTGTSFRSNFAGDGKIGGKDFAGSDDTRGNGGDGGNGGGLHARLFATSPMVQISNSLFDANAAGSGASGGDSPLPAGGAGTNGGKGGTGGGLHVSGNLGSVWRMRNTTVHRNFAGNGGNAGDGSTTGGTGGAGGDAGNGGGIAMFREGNNYTAEFVHVTVVSNADGTAGQEGFPFGSGDGADSSGGGIWEFPGGINGATGITLANSVVAQNEADTNPNIGAFVVLGSNFTGGVPELGELSDNGGPSLTVPPLFGSPLLDAAAVLAEPLVTDQRGVSRPFNGAPDLGAYEAVFQPDARVGLKSAPTTHRGDNVYNLSAVGQSISAVLSDLRRKSFFFSAQSDGDVRDDLRIAGTRANRMLSLTVYKLTGGRQNVTAQLAAGFSIPGLAPRGIVVFQGDVKARSKKRRVRQSLAFTLRDTPTNLVDVIRANVSMKVTRK